MSIENAHPHGRDGFCRIFAKKRQPRNHGGLASAFATGGPNSVHHMRDFQKEKLRCGAARDLRDVRWFFFVPISQYGVAVGVQKNHSTSESAAKHELFRRKREGAKLIAGKLPVWRLSVPISIAICGVSEAPNTGSPGTRNLRVIRAEIPRGGWHSRSTASSVQNRIPVVVSAWLQEAL
jgi:hypothetical protein